MMFRSIAKVSFLVVSATSLSLFAIGCGNGVSTQASANPTPTQNVTPTPSNTATPTPTATASPTPAPSAATCSYVWATDYSSVDGTIDFYEVDVLKDNFNANTNSFGDTAVGYFAVAYDPNTQKVGFAGMSTAGAMAMTAAGTTMGDAVTFTDTASHTFFDATDLFNGASQALGAQVATGGTGDFTGNLSDPNPANPATPGTGTITATDNNAISEIFADPNGAQPTITYAACSQ